MLAHNNVAIASLPIPIPGSHRPYSSGHVCTWPIRLLVTTALEIETVEGSRLNRASEPVGPRKSRRGFLTIVLLAVPAFL